MEWNVYVYNVNKQKMEKFNIFNHHTFVAYIVEAIKEGLNKELFEKRLQSELRYYFWSKAEWEIIVAPWVGNKNPDEVKVDVCHQVMMNWPIFLDYVWNHRNELVNEYES